MEFNFVQGAVWLAVGVSFMGARDLPAQEVNSSAWQLDFEAAKATAHRTGKPIFLIFR